MKYVKLKRQSYDIGIFGKKGSGKTLLLAYLGFLKELKDHIIFSNFVVSYPHVLVSELCDFNRIYDYPMDKPKVFLGDDFEFWFHSRSNKSSINKEMNDLLIFWGKMNCSLIYTSKRSMAIDIGIRETTSEFWFPEMRLMYQSDNEKYNKLLTNYLNFLKIYITRYDENLEELPSIEVTRLAEICNLYDTQSILNPLKF